MAMFYLTKGGFMFKNSRVAVFCIAAFSTTAYATDTCNALLRHGITERFREQNIDNRSSKIQSELCDAYNSFKSDSQSGGAKASYAAFSGSASFSRAQIESIGKLTCESNLSDSASNAVLETSSDKISQHALTAWRICNDQSKAGLQSETDFRNDNGTVSISIHYIPPVSTNEYPKFSGIVIFPKDSYKCEGSLTAMKSGDRFNSDSLSMTCERNTTMKETTTPDGDILLLPAASISIQTTAGAITRHVAPRYKNPPALPQRLGDIVSSMLDEGTFKRINGNGWVLADGRAVPNTDYAKLVGANVPDLRGVYLRGKNYSRDKAQGNADGDLAIGTYQAFEIIKHSHPTVQMIENNNVDGVDSTVKRSGEHHNEPRQTGEFGGNEVRPNSVTVNFFIRVSGTQ